jgi:N1-aminopropylagmatine ureohydrolase
MELPAGLRELGWELPFNFLGLEGVDFAASRAAVLPVPYEATTSWGVGTQAGPRAIIDASRYIELYDQELDAEPHDVGIATLPALELPRGGAAPALAALRHAYDAVLDAGDDRFIVALGGEHAISGPLIESWVERAGERLSVLQIDAHTDLRPSYHNTEYSHASVMYRVKDQVDIVAVGIRALTVEEHRLTLDARNIHVFLADDIHNGLDWIDDVIALLKESVYITFDVDGLDPTLVPSTGTPEPGGLGWYPVLQLLRRVFASRRVLAADVVELAPIPGLRAPDFLVAKLVYKMIGYRFAGAG